MDLDVAILLPNFLRPESLEKNLSLLGDLEIPLLISVDKYEGTDPVKSDLNRKCFDIAEASGASALKKSNYNLGCRQGIETALDWAVEKHQALIVIEDDLGFDVSAINFFTKLLAKFAGGDQVFLSGNNFSDTDRIHWTSCMHIWGWACTSASWKRYRAECESLEFNVRDVTSNDFDYKGRFADRSQLLAYISVVENLGKLARESRAGAIDTWDYQLAYYIFLRQIRVVAPSHNLFSNHGFDMVATHTTSGRSPKPIHHPFVGFDEQVNLNCETWSDISIANLVGPSVCPICEARAEFFGGFEGGLSIPLVYRKCLDCGHIFVRNCSWISEAYEDGIDVFDQGAVNRSLFTLPIAYGLSKRLGGMVLDYGGGSGLLARLLRDLGVDAYSFDKYARGSLNPGFHLTTPEVPDSKIELVIAIEVLEHITEINEFIRQIKNWSPSIMLTSTVMHHQQSIEWEYLDKNHCQHVSVFTRESIERLANKLEMGVHFAGVYQIFYKDAGLLKNFRVDTLSDVANEYEQLNYTYAALDNKKIVQRQSSPIFL